MAPCEASRGHRVLGEPEQLGDGLLLRGRDLVFWNCLALQQAHQRVLGAALCAVCLPSLCHHLGNRARQPESRGPVVQLLAQGLTLGLTACERLTALAGIRATFGARLVLQRDFSQLVFLQGFTDG